MLKRIGKITIVLVKLAGRSFKSSIHGQLVVREP